MSVAKTTAKFEFSSEVLLEAARGKLQAALELLADRAEPMITDHQVTEAAVLTADADELLRGLLMSRAAEAVARSA